MILLQIRAWEHPNAIKQIATLWEIATDEAFTDIIETVTTTGDQLNYLKSSITIPKGETYYVRATRKYEHTQADHTLNVVPVSNLDSVINDNIIHSEYVYVEVPYVYINEEEFNDKGSLDFEVSTSAFRCKQDGHVATHWIVTDINGEILYKSLYNNFDKTSIRLEKTKDLFNKSVFIIYAIHVSTNGVESEKGVLKYINNSFNFEIVGLTTDIPPYRDLNLYIEPATARDDNIESVFLKTQADDGSITRGVNVTPPKGSGTIFIPGTELSYDSLYYLDIYCYNTRGEYTSKRVVLKTRASSYDNNGSNNVYEKKIEEYSPASYASLLLPASFTCAEFPNGDILIPKRNSDKLIRYKGKYESTPTGGKIELDFGPGQQGYGERSDIVLGSTSSDNTLIKLLNDNLVLVDCYNTPTGGQTNKPVFMVYRYDPVNDLFTFMHSLTRDTESMPLGYTNNLAQVSEFEVWYLSADAGKLIAYNFVENSIREIATFSEIGYDKASLIYNRKLGKMMITAFTGKAITLDPEVAFNPKQQFTIDMLNIKESKEVPYTEWINSRLKPVELSNGDYLVLNIDNPGSNNSVAYYDSLNNSYSALTSAQIGTLVHSGVVTTFFSNYYINRTVSAGVQTSEYKINRLY